MKQIFTLILCICTGIVVHAQVVLNEVYPEPGAGKNEFFELYNTGTSSASNSVDGFTIVSYFDDGSNKGFYVLDLPDLQIAPKGYFVGSSAKPFNYQTTLNSSAANFSWNDPALVSMHGYLAKWVRATDNDATDGNKDYNMAPVPANLNDFFYNLSGGAATYNVFVFRNGVMVNTFFGGMSGSTFPAMIAAMPNLQIRLDIANLSNSSFTMNINSLTSSAFESVIANIGSDNGYSRLNDGKCGAWSKTSNGVNHTPGLTNGTVTGTSGQVNISANILQGVAAATTSTLSYNLLSAPGIVFPLDIYIYVDNGIITGELDAADTYLDTKTFTNYNSQAFTISFSPKSANIIMVLKAAAGCYDQVKLVSNIQNITLPVTLSSFVIDQHAGVRDIRWVVQENEGVEKMILEKNTGHGFSPLALLLGTDKKGTEYYSYKDGADEPAALYRLKIIQKTGQAFYSRQMSAGEQEHSLLEASLVGNPFHDKLLIRVHSEVEGMVHIRLLDASGRVILSTFQNAKVGETLMGIDVPGNIHKGLYYIEILQGNQQQFLKAIKM